MAQLRVEGGRGRKSHQQAALYSRWSQPTCCGIFHLGRLISRYTPTCSSSRLLLPCACVDYMCMNPPWPPPPDQAPAALLVLGLPVQGAWLPSIRVWSSSSPVKAEDERCWADGPQALADGFCPQTWASDWSDIKCGTSHHRRLLWAFLCFTWVQSQPPGATNHVCQGFLVKLSISVVKGEKEKKRHDIYVLKFLSFFVVFLQQIYRWIAAVEGMRPVFNEEALMEISN